MKQRLLIVLLVALLAAIAHVFLFLVGVGERFEPFALDLWFTLRGASESPSEVVVVALDEESYRQQNVPLNRIWPRALHAKLLQRLAEYKVKGVVFDVLFLDEGEDKEADAALAEAMKQVPVVLGTESTVQLIPGPSGAYSIEELLVPYRPFAESAAALALVGLPEDRGVIRRFQTNRTEQTQDLPTLAEAGAALAGSSSKRPGKRDFLKYYGPARSIRTFSFDQVIQTERPLPDQMLRDKVVFVGLALRTETGPAQKDVFGVPFYGQRVFGGEIHATAAANLIRGEWIQRLPSWVEVCVLSLLTFGLCTAVFLLSPLWGGITVTLWLILWCLTSFFAFLGGLFLPGVVLTVLILPIAYLGSTLRFYAATRREQQQIRLAFEHYLSPEMARQLSQNPKAISLGGEKLWATVLFTDIAGFTAISENMPAEQLAAMINAYFTEVMEVVLENKGTLIKFIGDAAFVLWGAPLQQDDHAQLAVKTALQMQQEVAKFNSSNRFPPLHTRIGIHTGPMVVGNLGSKRRFDYTAIGDSVNLASRLEGLNKYFGTTILMSGATRKEAAGVAYDLHVGAVRASGKREAVDLYTILDRPLDPAVRAEWETALEHFSCQRWDEASAAFTDLAAKVPLLSTAAALYQEQVTGYRNEPPPAGWSGEVVFRSK